MKPTPAITTRRLLGLALLAICTATTTRAGTIAFTDTLPTTEVIRQTTNLSASGNLQLRNQGSTGTLNRWIGSGFTVSSSTLLDRVTLYIYSDLVNTASLGTTIKVDVVSLASLTASPAAPYSTLYSETFTVPSSYSSQNYMTFDFTSAVALTANQNYGIVFSFVDTVSGSGINFQTTTGSTAGTNSIGSLFYTHDQGSTWTTAGNPLAFVLQTSPSNIPEPTTCAVILGLGALGITGLRRRARIA